LPMGSIAWVRSLRIAVIDLGGGTLDVTIMEFGKGVFEVKATSGDTQLGGTDMTRTVSDHVASRFREQTGVDIRSDLTASMRLLEAAEIAKIELTNNTNTRISLPFITVAGGVPKNLDMELTRTELERLVEPILGRCRPR
jgi:molecular chaperone DnaK